eukprot:TRINITY_DN16618_c0_g1_i2.p1 TRINITY_DN16618_c0_g1~~TRINITY_DN16618_c0_g1_i2.p1  ORF type:complete len:103 (-),score=26.67 TRINITY_DN16618_c0_g1_i2:201-509(-)
MISFSVMTTLLFILLLHSTKSDKSESISHSTISASISVNHTQDKTIMNTKEREDWPQKEIFAILGGVLGFWGGVWCLGIIFILVLMAKRVACKRGEERKKVL